MYKLAIVGSRQFEDFYLMLREYYACLSPLNLDVEDTIEIVSGGAKGADTLAEKLAAINNLPFKVFKADWSLGKSAGYKRNVEMADYCDGVLAFWDGKSKGTEHMIDISNKKGKTVIVYKYK